MTDKQQWLLEAVHYFRQMKFFQKYSGLTDEKLIAGIQAERERLEMDDGLEPDEIESLEDSIDLESAKPDLHLVMWDKSRIWYADIEQEFYPGDEGFKRILQEWSRISRGAFMPENIREIWPEDAPMYLQFNLNGQEHVLTPWETMPTRLREGYGMVDLEMLGDINEMIEDSGYFFTLYDLPYQDVYVVVLTEEEQQKLKTERGWQFAESDEE